MAEDPDGEQVVENTAPATEGEVDETEVPRFPPTSRPDPTRGRYPPC